MKIKGNLTYAGKDRHGTDRWDYRVDLPLDPITSRRRQASKRFSGTRRGVEKQALEFLHALEHKIYNIPSKLTLGQFLVQWIENHRIRPRVKETYSSIIHTHFVPGIGDIRLEKLSQYDLKIYFKNAERTGRKDGKSGGLSARTLNNHFIVLRSALEEAVADGLIPRNPAILPKGQRFFDKPKTDGNNTFNQRELEMFLSLAALENGYYAALADAVYTGKRRSEICGTQWRDIDFERSTMTVARSLHVLKGGEVITEDPKSWNSRRSIYIPSPLVSILSDLKTERQMIMGKIGKPLTPRDWVFIRGDLSPIRPNQLTKVFKRIAIAMGRPDITLHGLRHTQATLMAKEGAHPKVITERLGHHTEAYTMSAYGSQMPNMQKDAVDRLFPLLLGGGHEM